MYNNIQIYFSELETEYKRQIEYYKEEEKKAKELLRQMEIDFIKQKQTLELELDKERTLVIYDSCFYDVVIRIKTSGPCIAWRTGIFKQRH